MKVQARIPAALAAIHNAIRIHDPEEIQNWLPEISDPSPGRENGTLGEGMIRSAETRRAKDLRQRIAEGMWSDYQRVLRERGELQI